MRCSTLTGLLRVVNQAARALFIGLFWVVSSDLHSQNLIPNPSFEELEVECTGPVVYSYLQDWTTPVCGVGGIMQHGCSTANGYPNHGTPGNAVGYAVPVDGEAYCAIFTYRRIFLEGSRYYLTVQLLEPLLAGVGYCFSLHASLAERSVYSTPQLHAIFMNEQPFGCGGVDTLEWVNNAQVVLNTTGVDTSSWSLLSGSFIAAGGETYITIGNFRGRAEPDTVYLGPTTYPLDLAIYYLDALELRQCVVSVDERAEGGLRMAYDANARRVSITGPQATLLTDVTLHDMAGRMVLRDAGNAGTVQLDLSGLPDGVYLVQAQTGATQLSTRIVVY